MEDNQKTPSNRMNFLFGLVSGVAVVSLVGFLVILAGGKGGIIGGGKKADAPSADAPAVDTTPQDVKVKELTKDDHIRGSLSAKVKIVEYSDLECPFCKRHHATMQELVNTYGEDDLAWVYRHFPLATLHSKAPKEAEATECAAELGGNDGFWALADKIFEVTPTNNGLDLATLPDLAEEVGLDKAKFTECLDSGKYASKVQEQYEDAVAAGGQGTPHNIIIGPDDQKVPLAGAYPIESFKEIIDGMIKK